MVKLVAECGEAGHRPPEMKGHQVHTARVMLGMTQKQLANVVGIAPTTLNKIEAETGDPRLSSLEALEKYFVSRGIRFSTEIGVIGLRPPNPDVSS